LAWAPCDSYDSGEKHRLSASATRIAGGHINNQPTFGWRTPVLFLVVM